MPEHQGQPLEDLVETDDCRNGKRSRRITSGSLLDRACTGAATEDPPNLIARSAVCSTMLPDACHCELPTAMSSPAQVPSGT